MIGTPRLGIEIVVNVTGIIIGIKVSLSGIRIGIGIIEFGNLNHGFWNILESE